MTFKHFYFGLFSLLFLGIIACASTTIVQAPNVLPIVADTPSERSSSNNESANLRGSNDTRSLSKTKHALLIGVGDYPTTGGNGWNKLNAVNDLILIKETLLKQGFKENNITTKKDKEATKVEILKAISEQANKVSRGDIVVFHFSGHGQKVADDNGDEEDAYDEAIVPYDSPLEYQKGLNEGEKLIRDDELGEALNKIRIQLGKEGHLLVLLDACHSGTGTRDYGNRRGTDIVMASETYQKAHPVHLGNSKEIYSLNESVTTRGGEEDLASMFAIFSSKADEKSIEVEVEDKKEYGLLSYLFAKILTKNIEPSYRALSEAILLATNRYEWEQTPQTEGDLDQLIFGGAYEKLPNYFYVKKYHNPTSIELTGGQLHGFSKNTTVDFFEDNKAIKTQTKLAFGRVTGARLVDCDIKIESGNPTKEKLLQAKAIINTRSFDQLNTNLWILLPENGAFNEALIKRLKEYSVITLTDTNPDLILREVGNKIQLETKRNKIISSIPASEGLVEQLIQQILQHTQNAFLKELEIDNIDFKVRTTLLNSKQEACADFSVGEKMQIKVENDGEGPVYYQILEFFDEGELAILLPSGGESPRDYMVEPNDTQITKFDLAPPYGNYILKVILTDNPMDLRSVVNSRGNDSRDSLNPFEELMQATYITERSRSKLNGINVKEVGVSSLMYTIKE